MVAAVDVETVLRVEPAVSVEMEASRRTTVVATAATEPTDVTAVTEQEELSVVNPELAAVGPVVRSNW